MTEDFKIEEGVLLSYSGNETTITIPDNVKEINSSCFAGCSSLESIIIPDSVTEIKDSAFDGCSNLKNITLPENITEINSKSFYKCSSLESVIIPDSVTYIGKSAFDGCSNLKNITLSNNLIQIGDFSISECSSLESIIIPDSVTKIGKNPFAYNEKLKDIKVSENNSKFIFKENTLIDKENSRIVFVSPFIKKAYIPEDILVIDSYAFSLCNELKEISIPKNITEMNFYEFSDCDNLENINVDENHPKYTSIDGVIYSKNKEKLIYCPEGKVNYKIPNGTLAIGDFAFRDCKKLEKLEIADSVTQIGKKSFVNCSSLKTFTVPLGMSEISGYEKTSKYSSQSSYGLFEGCDSLETLYIHEHVSKIGHCTFLKCNNLRKIVFGNKKLKITVHQFEDFNQLAGIASSIYPSQLDSETKSDLILYVAKILLDNENKDIDEQWCKSWIKYLKTTKNNDDIILNNDDVFTVMTNEKLIDLEQVNRLKEQAKEKSLDNVFKKLEEYENNNFSDKDFKKAATKKNVAENKNSVAHMKKIWSFKELEDNTLMLTSYKGDETDVIVPSEIGNNKVTVIEADTFNPNAKRISDDIKNNRNQIKSITIPESIIRVDEAFNQCGSLEKLIINAKIDVLRKSINAPKLSEVKLPDSMTKLDSNLFAWCKNLEKVEFSDNLTEIGRGAFYNCEKLQDIQIPDSITSIGVDAFYCCKKLQNIQLPDSITSIGYDAFYDCKELKNIKLPVGLTKLESGSFQDCENLEKVEFSDNITEIGQWVFSGCKKIKNIQLPDSVTTIGYKAFNGCDSLQEIEFPEGIKTFSSVVDNCQSLKRIKFPASLEKFDFIKDCPNLENIELDEKNEFYASVDGVLYSKDLTTLICVPGSRSEFNIPSSVTKIGDYAFNNCEKLTSVIIPENVIEIGNSVFYNCKNIKSFTFKNKNLNVSNTFGGEELLLYIRDIVPSQLEGEDKKAVFNDVINIIHNEKDIDKEWKDLWLKYIKTRIRYIYDSIIENENIRNVVTSEKLLTIKDVKELLNISSSKSLVDITALLLDYQNKTFSDQYIIGDTEKDLAKEFSFNVEDPSSVSYLKKIWTTKKLDDGTLEIVNYKGEDLDIEVPGVIGKNKVSSIGELAFSPEGKRLAKGQDEIRSKITSIIINEGITNISPSAFYCCESLKTLKLPNGITEIKGWKKEGSGRYDRGEYYGFLYGCNNIEGFELPSSITKIGDCAFYDCKALKEIVIPDSVVSLGKCCFYGTGISDFIMPDSVTTLGSGDIEDSWYYGCFSSELKSIKLSKNITEIPDYFFYGLDVASLIIPDNVTTIGRSAFYNCGNLESLMIPNSVTAIGEETFKDCKKLKSLTIPDSVTTIGGYAFYNCESLESLIIPDSVTTIGRSAFYNCESLESLIIPDSVTAIGGSLFVNCKNLQSVKLSESLTDLITTDNFYGNPALFYGCEKLTSIKLPESIVNISKSSFYDCNYLEEVILGSNVKNIEQDAFYKCINLKSIIIPDTVEKIDNYAFQGCSKLKEITVNTGTIGANAFYECDNLETVHIGKNVTSIAVNAFRKCKSLTSFESDADNLNFKVINNSFISLDGKTLLFVAGGISEYTVPDGIEEIGENCFIYNMIKKVSMPDSVKVISAGAFLACEALEEIELSKNIESISDKAFLGCKELKNITITEKAETLGSEIFSECDNITVHGKDGSAIEVYARQNNIPFASL